MNLNEESNVIISTTTTTTTIATSTTTSTPITTTTTALTTTTINETNFDKSLNNDNNTFLCGVVEGFYGRPWTLDQRKDLFVKLQRFGMNVYMYAPKDDLKHRNLWRELYTVEESEQLSVLISNSKSNNILFIYAISPGLDIGYSNAKDLQALKRKLDQVKQLGCEAFALLFDDIEPELNENDREAFKSFASAQVSVTNDIYQHLDQPKFLFCPTEYCSSRAVPNVQNSDYLQTIGTKLMKNIDIMWTGNRVISQNICLQQIQELTDVLRRKPIIWDNLHANDYDQKRLFLGPYCDRSTKLIPHLNGVLTNPNCEYEANFIPIYTLGQWSKCTKDANDLNNQLLLLTNSDIKLETECDNNNDNGNNGNGNGNGNCNNDLINNIDSNVYHHRNALRIAIKEWICEFYKVKNPQIKQNLILGTTNDNLNGNNINNNNNNITINYDSLLVTNNNKTIDNNNNNNDNNSMIDNDIDDIDNKKDQQQQQILVEPMDCSNNQSPDTSLKLLNNNNDIDVSDVDLDKNDIINSLDVPMIENNNLQTKTDDDKDVDDTDDTDETMQTENIDNTNTTNNNTSDDTNTQDDNDDKSTMLTYDDIALLVDLFYLPFEHGQQGIKILQEFHWLKTNGFIVSEYRHNKKESNDNVDNTGNGNGNSENNEQQQQNNTNSNSVEINEWYERAAKFNEMTMLIGRLLTRLTFCKNRSLLYELYPYVWDIKGVISLLNSYVKWIALGRIPVTYFFQPLGLFPATFTWFSKGYKEAFQSGEQEPWLFRGGLTGELQRMLPVESVSDLFLYKAPESPTSHIYTIRPYLPSDVQSVYEICFKNYDHHVYLEDQDELVGDKLIGGFLTLSPEYCFVVEDDQRLCGYALAVLDAKKFFNKLQITWIPELLKKYPLSTLLNNNNNNTKNNNDDALVAEQRSLKEKYIGQFVNDMHNQYKQPILFDVPEEIFQLYPSLVSLAVMSNIIDLSVPKRMLTCVIAALKANGSKGLHCRISSNDKKALDFYLKLGFQTINLNNNNNNSTTENDNNNSNDDDIYVGRII